MQDKTVVIEPKLYDFVVQEARRNRRTIKGQVEVMLEMGRSKIEREDRIRTGETETQYTGHEVGAE